MVVSRLAGETKQSVQDTYDTINTNQNYIVRIRPLDDVTTSKTIQDPYIFMVYLTPS